jgi:hypothetical protein
MRAAAGGAGGAGGAGEKTRENESGIKLLETL